MHSSLVHISCYWWWWWWWWWWCYSNRSSNNNTSDINIHIVYESGDSH